jgi:hypothetical protein
MVEEVSLDFSLKSYLQILSACYVQVGSTDRENILLFFYSWFRLDGCNVAYQEVTVQPGHDFPVHLLPFLPNIPYSSSSCQLPRAGNVTGRATTTSLVARRLVALVTTRDVAEGEELLSSYFTLVTST